MAMTPLRLVNGETSTIHTDAAVKVNDANGLIRLISTRTTVYPRDCMPFLIAKG